MAVAAQKLAAGKFAFSSSVEADVWHPGKPAGAYEWWYFDALSTGGKEAVVITFLDNLVYSPRYNAANPDGKNHPAVSFVYYENGRPLYRTVNEFEGGEFSASGEEPQCRIGESSFKFESAPYGSGYVVSINAYLSGGRRLKAHFEWLSIEADLSPGTFCHEENSHCWNMVAPRSDVTGRITVFGRDGGQADVKHFRGTGYHDHSLDNRWMPQTVRDWQWGRCHFGDSTAVFYRYCEIGQDMPSTGLYVIRDGVLREREAEYSEQNYVRDRYGIRYPTRLRLITEDDLRLRVKPIKVIDSSFYFLRFLSEMTLTLRDGKPRKTIGITEYYSPKALKYRWLNWWTDLRIGKNGKGSRF